MIYQLIQFFHKRLQLCKRIHQSMEINNASLSRDITKSLIRVSPLLILLKAKHYNLAILFYNNLSRNYLKQNIIIKISL